ncbi:MAG: hypothetical protein WCK90_01680 [archaeon]
MQFIQRLRQILALDGYMAFCQDCGEHITPEGGFVVQGNTYCGGTCIERYARRHSVKMGVDSNDFYQQADLIAAIKNGRVRNFGQLELQAKRL